MLFVLVISNENDVLKKKNKQIIHNQKHKTAINYKINQIWLRGIEPTREMIKESSLNLFVFFQPKKLKIKKKKDMMQKCNEEKKGNPHYWDWWE